MNQEIKACLKRTTNKMKINRAIEEGNNKQEELKWLMNRCKSVNWSEVARKAFEDAARKEEIPCAAETIKNLRIWRKAE